MAAWQVLFQQCLSLDASLLNRVQILIRTYFWQLCVCVFQCPCNLSSNAVAFNHDKTHFSKSTCIVNLRHLLRSGVIFTRSRRAPPFQTCHPNSKVGTAINGVHQIGFMSSISPSTCFICPYAHILEEGDSENKISLLSAETRPGLPQLLLARFSLMNVVAKTL